MLAASLPNAEEIKLGRVLVETTVLLSRHDQGDTAMILRDAAHDFQVDVGAIIRAAKQAFAAKEKSKPAKKTPHKSQTKAAKITVASPHNKSFCGANNPDVAFLFPAARCPIAV